MSAILGSLLTPAPVCTATDDPFAWRHLLYDNGTERIHFDRRGTFVLENNSGEQIDLSFFLWRDEWVFRALDNAVINHREVAVEGGVLRQAGTWRTDTEILPLDYELLIQPSADGVTVHLRLTRTGAITVIDGIWCRLDISDSLFLAGRGVRAMPGSAGTLGRIFAEVSEGVAINVSDTRAAVIEFDSPRRLRSKRQRRSNFFEANLIAGELPLHDDMEAILQIRFADSPPVIAATGSSDRPLALRGVAILHDVVSLYDKVELVVELEGQWQNPYDPGDVRLDALVTTASGRTYKQPGFFIIDFDRIDFGDGEVWRPSEASPEGRWLIRLTAMEIGDMRCQLTASDGVGSVREVIAPIRVVEGRNRGFVRAAPADPHYLQYANGANCFLIGQNLPIYSNRKPTTGAILRKMASHGQNAVRIWMSSDSLGLEWEAECGWYRQESAARLDRLFDVAGELGFNIILCLDTHHDFLDARWDANPYNHANGGPCIMPPDWFVDPGARRLYKQRLRYLTARWAYSPNLLCWELGNEFEGWPEATEASVTSWHREMSGWLNNNDPYDHLVTTSWWTHMGNDAVSELPHIDVVQTHCYTNNNFNVAEPVRNYCFANRLYYNKPHIFSEFGVDSQGPPVTLDPRGWSLHNAMWAAVASGCASVAMPWWHDSYIEPLNLHHHFRAIGQFVSGIPFALVKWQPMVPVAVDFMDGRSEFKDIVILPDDTWGRSPTSTFSIAADGTVANERDLRAHLHGTSSHDMRNPPTFVVNYPGPGRFIMTIGRVSRFGHLRIWVDGQLAFEHRYPAGEAHGRAWVYQPKWNLWHSYYGEDVEIKVPPGRHEIRVANDGRDWMRIDRYAFTDSARVVPPMLVAGMRSPVLAFAWLHNKQNTWYQIAQGSVPPVPPTRVVFDQFAPGEYQLEWWDTWDGRPVRTVAAVSDDGYLSVLLDRLETDVAVKITAAIPDKDQ